MQIAGGALLSFVLLGLAICAVWLPNITLGARVVVAPWLPLFIGSAAVALVSGIIEWPALLALAALAGAGALAERTSNRLLAATLIAAAALLALALGLHAMPGFHNPIIVGPVRISADAAAFNQYANFDKAAAGLLLLVFFCPRIRNLNGWRRIARPTAVAAAATAAAVSVVSFATGVVQPDLKLPAFALTFLSVNLLFTCVAEEAFFRGLLQERMTRAVATQPLLRWLPVAASSVLFGLVHFGGGALLVLLATIAGIGYSLAYAATRRIEAAVLTHFAVNMVHFFGFTYPQLQM